MNAARLYLWSQALTALANSVMFTTYALFYVQTLGLTPLQLVLVGTAVELAVLLFELPTGVVADTYGRRPSVITGSLVMGAAYLLEGAVPFWGRAVGFFWAVALAEVVRGLGWTFVSGAEEAWITDEVGVERVGNLHVKAGQWRQAASLAGIGLSVLLANRGLHLPFLAGGALVVGVGILQWINMRETAFRPVARTGARAHWQGMRETLAESVAVVRGRPVLLALLAVAVIAGAASEGVDRLGETHLLVTFQLTELFAVATPTIFGSLSAVGSVLSILVAAVARRRLDLSAERVVKRTLLLSAALRTGLLLAFALAPSFWLAAGASTLYYLLGTVYHPVYRAWLNQQIDSRVRASVLSLVGQADALGQSGGGPVVGWVAGRFSLRAALVLAAAFLSPALALFGTARTDSGRA